MRKVASEWVVLLCFMANPLFAQRFGGNPNTLKWKVLEGKYARVIHPKGTESPARRIMELGEKMMGDTLYSLGNAFRKIPIVLQTLPTYSNAYVGLGPWRSEFYLYPPQNALQLGSTEWIDNLSYHEFRHVQQFSNFRKGLSRFAYLLAGEQGQALANAASIPDWFFEGDAVFMETQYLAQGRGRLPSFFDPFRSLWLADKHYGYQKLRNGSLKDFVPDHYALGYLMVDYGYRQFGQDFWGKVTQDASRYNGLVYPFQRAVKKYSGMNFKKFASSAMDSFRNLRIDTQRVASSQLMSTITSKQVINYHFPVWVGKDSVIALKKAFRQIPHWVVIHAGKESRVGVKDISYDDYYTFRDDKLVYSAYIPDARWSWREYSDIHLFDIRNNQRRRLTHYQRYVSPDLSHDGKSVVAIAVLPGGTTKVELLDAEEGKVRKSFSDESGHYFSYPVFSNDDSSCYVIARNKEGFSTIMRINLSDGGFKPLFTPIQAPLSFLKLRSDKLLFSVSQRQTNQLWDYDLNEKTFHVLADGVTGSYGGDLNPADGRVVFTKPTAEGEQVFLSVLGSDFPEPNHPLSDIRNPTSDIRYPSSNTQYPISNFRHPLSHIHSWRPFYEQPEWSFSLYGENTLNTVQSTYDYVYNENEGSHKVAANLAYGGLYPWVTGGVAHVMNRTFRDSLRTIHWNEWNGNLGLRLPFNFSSGRLYKYLDLSARWNGSSVNYDEKKNPNLRDKYIQYLQQQVSWSIQTQQAVQHIFPRFAFAMRLQNRVSLGKTASNQTYTAAQLFVPGFARTHSLVGGFAFQSRDTLRQYAYSNGFPMARGYQAFDYPRMWRYSINYHMPLAYPDFGVGNIVYFLRVRSNAFYDDMSLKSLRTGRVINLRSAGAEIYFDTKWWNQQPVTFGVRYSRLLDTDQFSTKPNPNRFEFIMPVNLIPN